MPPPRPARSDAPEAIVAGALMWDVLGRTPGRIGRGADLPGRVRRRPGGVAGNLAAALAAAGVRTALLAAAGRSGAGAALVAVCRARGVVTRWLLRVAGGESDLYLGIEDEEGLAAAVADTALLDAAGAAVLAPLLDGRVAGCGRRFAGTVALDGNLSAAALAAAAASPALAAADLRLVAAAPAKAARLLPFRGRPRTTLYLNLAEARALAAALGQRPPAAAAPGARVLVAAGFARAIVTDGPRPVAECGASGERGVAPAPAAAAQVTGAGDALVAAHIVAEMRGADAAAALAAAVAAAGAHVRRCPDAAAAG